MQPTGTFSQPVDLSVFLLIFELKNGPTAEHVTVVLRSIYQSKFFKKYCRRNFRAIDLMWNSYFLFAIIIFDEKYRKNEKNRFLNFKSTDYTLIFIVDLKNILSCL